MDEAGEENEGKRSAIVLEEHAKSVREETAPAELAAEVGDHEDEQSSYDGEVEGLAAAETLENLDSLLKIDKGDVEAEDVAGEAGDIFEKVTRVGYCKYPVEDQRPAA